MRPGSPQLATDEAILAGAGRYEEGSLGVQKGFDILSGDCHGLQKPRANANTAGLKGRHNLAIAAEVVAFLEQHRLLSLAGSAAEVVAALPEGHPSLS